MSNGRWLKGQVRHLSAAVAINCRLLFHQKSITVRPLIGEVDKRMEMDAERMRISADDFSLLCVRAPIELGRRVQRIRAASFKDSPRAQLEEYECCTIRQAFVGRNWFSSVGRKELIFALRFPRKPFSLSLGHLLKIAIRVSRSLCCHGNGRYSTP